MKRFFLFFTAMILSYSGFAQNLNDYSYVIIPDHFEFQAEPHQYKLNEMTKFYFDKYGFNAFLSTEKPNAPECDGLYANVEQIWVLVGSRLEIVLKDCEGVEVYRSDKGRSNYKEFEKNYQDALRNAFSSIRMLQVKQPPLDATKSLKNQVGISDPSVYRKTEKPSFEENFLPSKTLTAYTSENQGYLLRKTHEGYSLFKETETVESGLQLIGKIVQSPTELFFSGTEGKEGKAVFQENGTLIIIFENESKIFLVSE